MRVSKSRPVVVLGASGHAKVVIGLLQTLGMSVGSVYDDDRTKAGAMILGVRIAGTISDIPDREGTLAVLAIGDNAARLRVSARFKRLNWATLVHPAAWVHPSARLGPGTVVFAGAVIQPDSLLGTHVIVNTAASVDHDCVIGDFAHLAPGSRLAGHVRVGAGALLGLGATVIPAVSIGDWARVGAGAVVIADVPGKATAVGVPARILRPRVPRQP